MVRIFTLLVLLLFSLVIYAQEMELNIRDEPLSEVLLLLNEKYNIQFSFDHRLATGCRVTNNEKFVSKEKLITALLINCDLTYEMLEGIFYIKKKTKKKPKKRTIYYYTGQILDAKNGEPLPYSNIQTVTKDFNVDDIGNFSFHSPDSNAQIVISHVGYYIVDSLILPNTKVNLLLTPSIVGLQEIVVKPSETLFSVHIGEKTGQLKLNHKLALFLPGNNNNTLFNMLRLQPGILATSEQDGGYLIWGGYPGQALLEFDGIPLFNATSLNHEIGVVNPLIIKDVEVYKGAYSLEKADRIGGVVSMTGRSGNFDLFETSLNISTKMLSGCISIPLTGNYALQVAVRKSYFDFIDVENRFLSKRLESSYKTDFKFKDINFKFSGKTKKGDNFYISFLNNEDESSFSYSSDHFNKENSWKNLAEEKQFGIAAYYNKNWNKWGSTNSILSYSRLGSVSSDKFERESNEKIKFSYERENKVVLINFKSTHLFPSIGMHKISTGIGLVVSNVSFLENFFREHQSNTKEYNSQRYNYFLKDKISLMPFLNIQPSFKLEYIPNEENFFFRPHLDVSIKPIKNWKINLGWGIYNQYLLQMNLVDGFGNSFYIWELSGLEEIPNLHAIHSVLGLTYKKNDLLLSLEGYYKTTLGISKYRFDREEEDLTLVKGEGRSMGLDFYAEKMLSKHKFWISYSLGKVEEKYPFFKGVPSNRFEKADYNQTHEVKMAAILNFSPWFFSANYVYGSGFYNKGRVSPSYSRFDIAILYKFQFSYFRLETGLSVINIFDNENVTLNGVTSLPNNIKIFERAAPFSPSIFANFKF